VAEIGKDAGRTLHWAEGLETGVAEIDADHRLLIDRSNALLYAVEKEHPKTAIMAIVSRMVAECREHFRREDSVLQAGQYGGAKEHAAEHRRIEGELDQAIDAIGGSGDLVNQWKSFALAFQALLIEHFLRYDLKYKSHLLWERGR